MGAERHFLDVSALDTVTLHKIIGRGLAFKGELAAGKMSQPLAGKTLVLIFEKPSTRTRVSFQVGMQQLGGMVVVMSEKESQLGHGETIVDTARVLSRYADAIMIRTDNPQKLAELAAFGSVPVINGLTDESHPCQIMADVMTFEEHRGSIEGKTVAWSGAGNNVASSWIHAAVRFGFKLRLGCPATHSPSPAALAWAASEGGDVAVVETAEEAVDGANLVVTDAWVSMGDENPEMRHQVLLPFCVDEKLMARARPDALFMHCLPAHRGEEAADAVLDGPQSVIWDEAENRLHVQKGILSWCMS
ncbi:MAG: ornithine carbamoyltransferase [Pseudomonadota bacterium]|nr:ornithine carbamoyltransferase [Pseudomonadota bacterium]